MKRNIKIVFLGLFLAFMAGFYAPTYGADINDLKSQIDAKNEEIQKLEEEMKQYKGSIEGAQTLAKTLNAQIAKLNAEIKALNTQISLTSTKISKKELEIRQLGYEIENTETAMIERQKAIKGILISLNQSEENTAFEVFLKFGTISDFFTELENIEVLNGKIRENFGQLQDLKAELGTKKNSAEFASKDLKTLKSELVDQKLIQEQGKTEKNSVLKLTKNKESLYQKLLRETETKRAEIAAEIRAIESELTKLIDLSSLPPFGRGVLLKPIDGGTLTQLFGKTEFAAVTDVYGNGVHNGVDFKASVGASIFAADKGVVKAVGNSDLVCNKGSYGKWILIDHPNKLATLYAHLSLIKVTQGQNVNRGDIIGLSGNTGYTTGPHLHFTVYDSRTVELRKSRVCGILPYGGYLDPMLYI